jgi:hypothetical protein
LEQHETLSRSHFNDFVMFEEMWHSIPSEHPSAGKRKGKKRSNRDASTFIPEFFRDTESVTSDQMALLFGEEPWFELVPNQWDADLIVNTFKTQSFLEAQLEEMDFEVKYEEALRSSTRDGTGIIETPWVFDSHWELDHDGSLEGEEKLDYAGPGLLSQPLIGFHFYPHTHELKPNPYVLKVEKVHESAVTKIIGDAKRFREAINVDVEVATKEEVLDTQGVEGEDDVYAKQVRETQRWQAEPDDDGLVEIIDYWGEHPTKKDSPYVWRIIIANRSKTVVEIPNPYQHGEKPFLRMVHVPRQRSFYGMGIGHQIWRKQKEINDFRGYGRDIMKMQLLNQWQRKGGTREGMDTFNMQPMKIYQEEEDGIFSPLRPPIEVIQFLLQMEGNDLEAMRFASGATFAAQGIPTDTTATEFKGAERVTDRRILQIAKRNTRMGLRPFLRRMIQLNKQFKAKPRMVNVLGKPMLVGGKDLVDNVTIKLRMATSTDSRNQMARRTAAALETIMKVSEFKAKIPNSPYNLDPIVAQAVKLLGVDPSTVVPEARKATAMLGLNRLGSLSQDQLLREAAVTEIEKMAQATPESGVVPAGAPVGGEGLIQ